MTPLDLAALGLLLAAAVGAAFRAGKRERIGAGLLAAAWAVTLPSPGHWAVMTAHLAIAIGLGWLSWRAPRSWPVWALACQAVAVAASLAYGLQPDVGEDVWRRALSLTACGSALALGVSLWRPRLATA